MTKVVDIIKKAFNSFDLDITKYPSRDLRRRRRILNYLDIDLILDVGANKGQYALEMRNLGFRNKIISFEPLTSVYSQLQMCAASDSFWETYNIGLGDQDEGTIINISENLASSSILPINQISLDAAPYTRTVSQESIILKRLDTFWAESKYEVDLKKVLLKIDTQGYEYKVLLGAGRLLKDIAMIQLEGSLVEVYSGEMVLKDLLIEMDEKGFDLISLEPGFEDLNTGRLLQTDCIFVNRFFVSSVS